MELMVLKANKDLVDQQDQKVYKDQQDLRASREFKEYKVNKDLKDLQVTMASKEFRVNRDLPAVLEKMAT